LGTVVHCGFLQLQHVMRLWKGGEDNRDIAHWLGVL
jgi:hypothetical protein